MTRRGRKKAAMDVTLASREVDNPLLTDGLIYGDGPVARRITVIERPVTRIGALCHIRDRQPHHERAAELFRVRYEAAYGSGVPAQDNARPMVDRTIVAHDGGMAARVDRATMIREAIEWLGDDAADRLIALLVLEIPAGEGLHWRDRQRAIATVLADLDRLAEHWHLLTVARGRSASSAA